MSEPISEQSRQSISDQQRQPNEQSKQSIAILLKKSLLFVDLSIQRGAYTRKELEQVLNFAKDLETTLQQLEPPRMSFSGL